MNCVLSCSCTIRDHFPSQRVVIWLRQVVIPLHQAFPILVLKAIPEHRPHSINSCYPRSQIYPSNLILVPLFCYLQPPPNMIINQWLYLVLIKAGLWSLDNKTSSDWSKITSLTANQSPVTGPADYITKWQAFYCKNCKWFLLSQSPQKYHIVIATWQ